MPQCRISRAGIPEYESFDKSELVEMLADEHPVRKMIHELYEKLRASELRSFGTSPFGLRTFRKLFLAVDVLQRHFACAATSFKFHDRTPFARKMWRCEGQLMTIWVRFA